METTVAWVGGMALGFRQAKTLFLGEGVPTQKKSTPSTLVT